MIRRLLSRWTVAAGIVVTVLTRLGAPPPADAQGTSRRPWLGVTLGRDHSRPGVLVGHVVRGSPAEKAGVREGDRILRVDTTPVTTGDDVIHAVATHAVGDAVSVVYLRADREMTARTVLAEFPAPDEMIRMDLVGHPAPEWGSVTPVAGSIPRTVLEARGHVVVLDFWATWCGPCRVVTPKLSLLQARRGAEGLTVIGLSSEDSDAVLAYVRRQPPRYPLGVDAGAETARRYGVVSLPTLVVIDRQGIVRDVFVGYDPDTEGRLDSELQALLAETVPSP